MNPWKELYTELAEKITTEMPDIRWVDLWHEQVQYLTAELPFPVPAVFLGFQTIDIDDIGDKVQLCNTQVDFYLFYETFSDTYQGAYNQGSALEFLDSLNAIHAIFHGESGVNYSSMRRLDMKREESGGAGNLYRISFGCSVEDAGAKDKVNERIVANGEVGIGRETTIEKPPLTDTEPLYFIPD